jgi:phenylalanyl-tRNA synthetase alpha chain
MPDHPVLETLRARLAGVSELDAVALEAEEIAVLGRKQGELTLLLRDLATRSLEEKRTLGRGLNTHTADDEAPRAARRAELARAARAADVRDVDLTMPGREAWIGTRHPVTLVVEEIVEIFRGLGFAVAVGPEAENEERNFFALNFPPDHPAMDLHDTLFLDPQGGATGDGGRVLMRTHTSPVQIRVMRAGPPPYRVVIPGLAYRSDPFDASHAPAFTQIEGLAVDEGVSFVDLKATLRHFAERFFGTSVKVRFRPSFFPFTEPSAEMDVSCQICGGTACPACKGTGWMEILGCGMVHEKVLRSCDVDPERWTGWAFGMGPHRITMLRYGLPDIRLLYGGDMRLLSQFGELGR